MSTEFRVPGSSRSHSAGPDQAVVEVLVAGLNPVDVAICAGRFYAGKPPLPSVAGREGVGMLDGNRVYFDTPITPFGSMAERALIDPASAYSGTRRPRRRRCGRARNLRACRVARAHLARRAQSGRARVGARRQRRARSDRRAGGEAARRGSRGRRGALCRKDWSAVSPSAPMPPSVWASPTICRPLSPPRPRAGSMSCSTLCSASRLWRR